MEVRLSIERERYVRRLVDGGHYVSASELIEAALRQFEAREAACPLRRAVALGVEEALAGRSVVVTPEDIVRQASRRGAWR